MQKEIRVTLSGMSHDGRAVGRLDENCGDLAGLTVFVENAVLGQEVNALILNRKKNFLEAKCLQVLKQSPYYEESLCPHSGECGGCTWRNIRYSAQADEKQKFLLNSLVRLGKFDRDAVEEKMFPLLSPLDLPEQNTDFYRNKMEFAFGFEENVLKLGLRKKNSHKIVEVTDCRLQNSAAMDILKILRHTLKDFQGCFFRYAVLRFFGDKRTVELITYPFSQKNRQNEQNAIKNCWQALSSAVSGFIHSERRDKADIAYGERVIAEYGDTALSETLHTENGSFVYSLGNTAFFQVNSKMTEVLYSVVGSFAGLVLPETNAHVWDFYCGIGSISLTLAPLCLENRRNGIMPRYKNINAVPCAVRYKKPFLLGVELVESAVALAKKNAELNSCTFARFECAEAKKLAQYFKRFSLPHLLVFDPPRAGMDEETVRAVLEYRPPFLILVSCNAATLARDLQKLCAAYRIEAIQGVDLFPHTPHVETVVLLSLI